VSFQANRIYPLRDPQRFDDEYGEGYAFVKVADYGGGCLMSDCWVINAKGEGHPGLESSPVPVRYVDVVDDPMQMLRSLAA
jgi:hypothetical protein